MVQILYQPAGINPVRKRRFPLSFLVAISALIADITPVRLDVAFFITAFCLMGMVGVLWIIGAVKMAVESHHIKVLEMTTTPDDGMYQELPTMSGFSAYDIPVEARKTVWERPFRRVAA